MMPFRFNSNPLQHLHHTISLENRYYPTIIIVLWWKANKNHTPHGNAVSQVEQSMLTDSAVQTANCIRSKDEKNLILWVACVAVDSTHHDRFHNCDLV